MSSTANEAIRLGLIPFQVAFFEGSTAANNWIPFGSNIANGDYNITQLAQPNINIDLGNGTILESDGNNVIYATAIENNTGSNQTIFYYIQTRVIQGIGGGVDE